jgi:hypothetical protein
MVRPITVMGEPVRITEGLQGMGAAPTMVRRIKVRAKQEREREIPAVRPGSRRHPARKRTGEVPVPVVVHRRRWAKRTVLQNGKRNRVPPVMPGVRSPIRENRNRGYRRESGRLRERVVWEGCLRVAAIRLRVMRVPVVVVKRVVRERVEGGVRPMVLAGEKRGRENPVAVTHRSVRVKGRVRMRSKRGVPPGDMVRKRKRRGFRRAAVGGTENV